MTADDTNDPAPAAPTHGRTLLRRLSYTPLRDVIRGRLTGRLDLDALLEDAALPAPAEKLVRRVARRTRLTPLERVDVARELIAHARDAVESGRTGEEIVAAFGDEKRAARLIRRAKLRTRPLAWRVARRIKQGALLSVCALVVLYGVAAIRLWTGRPNPKHDYVADLNAPALDVPENERAWPAYRAALLSLEDPKAAMLDSSGLGPGPGGPRSPSAPTQAYLERNQQGLARLRAASRLPHLGYVAIAGLHDEDLPLFKPDAVGAERPSEAPQADMWPTMGLLLPYLSSLRTAARLLGEDALLAAQMGHGDRCLADLDAMLRIGEHVREHALLISDLVGAAILALTVDKTNTILADNPGALSDAQLWRLAHRLTGFSRGGPLALHLERERLWFYDLLQTIYTDDGHGDGRLTASGLRALAEAQAMGANLSGPLPGPLAPIAGAVVADRRSMRQTYDRLMDRAVAWSARPLWERGAPSPDQDVESIMSSPLERFRYHPIVSLMPGLGGASVSLERATQQRDAALVVIALELFRRHRGGWPGSLDRLVPDLLPAIPPDRYDGKALKYVLRDGRPILYSAGADGTDDGGVAPVYTSRADWRPSAPRGDWILWPPPEPPPPPGPKRESAQDQR